MFLEERGGHFVVHFTFHGAAHDRRLVLARGQNENLPRLEDGLNAHRERLAGHVFFAEEVSRGVLPGHQIEGYQPGATLGSGTRLIEPDVAGPPDSKELDVYATSSSDLFFIAAALILERLAGQVTPGQVYILRQNVQVGEEVLPHEPVVGVDAPRVHGVVLVEIEGDNIGKAQTFLLVQADKLAVDSYGSRSGGQAQHRSASRLPPGSYDLGDPASHQDANSVMIIHDDGADPLAGSPRRKR
jgi:hypothetical protein